MTILLDFALAITIIASQKAQLVIPIALQGDVLRVTTLAAKGPGSLRAALEDPRPRLVVFEVGGIIDLEGRTLVVRSPHLILAGQTAPDPGITLIRGGLIVETHDVRIEHIAVRPGDARSGDGGGQRAEGGSESPSPRAPSSSSALRPLPSAISDNWAPDALGVRRGAAPVYDVIFDHCSATWAVDENLSTSGPGDVDAAANPDATAHDITLRNCLIAEGLSRSTHPKGEHSKGTLVHDGVRNVSIEGCLFAHNRERNPRLKGGSSARVIGNVMYNWGSACVGVGARGNQKMLQPAEAVLAGNVAIAGPDTRGKVFVKSVDPGGKVSMRANVIVSASGSPLTLADEGVVVSEAPTDAREWAALPHVLRTAGSRPARRDPIDARIVRSVIDGTGTLINSQEEVGGYPVRAVTRRALVVPKDRKAWLEKLSRDLGEDATLDVAPLLRRVGAGKSAPKDAKGIGEHDLE